MRFLVLIILNKTVNFFFAFLNLFHTKRTKVLMFHEIVKGQTSQKLLHVSINDFEELVVKLSAKSNVISIDHFFDCFNDLKIESQYVVTFDDIYESVYEHAFPLLKAHNIPFTLFVNLSLLDTPNYISTTQLIEMAQCDLCTIGSHGIKHVFYRNHKKADFLNELSGSRKMLESIINYPVSFFAFPYGSLVACSFKNIKHLKNSDYKMAFSTIPSGVWNSVFISKFFVPRINVTKEVINRI